MVRLWTYLGHFHGSIPGATYRVGCKPILGVFDSCDDYQEGDYGYFCPITIIDPSAFGALESGEALFSSDPEQIVADDRLEVMQLSSYDLLTFDVRESGLDGMTNFSVVDMNGINGFPAMDGNLMNTRTLFSIVELSAVLCLHAHGNAICAEPIYG